MAVPTLPIIGTPPHGLFLALDYLPLVFLVLVLIVWQGYIMVTLLRYYVAGQNQCEKCLEYKAIKSVGDNACVTLFPNLFKKHKDCTDDNEKTFIIFLDRNIEKQVLLKSAFYSLAFSIVSASALVFFRLFPVALSDECLEKDAVLRPLFCYTNQSDFPVDCAEFANDTMESSDSFEVVCYALSASVGLAVAAAVGFAKLVAVLVTIYVRAGEFWLTKNWNKCCFIILSILAFAVVTGVAAVYVAISVGGKISNTPEATGELVARFAYIFLPGLAAVPFCIIACTLDIHCKQDQYSTLCEDQKPKDQAGTN